jgi:PEP-CTERM motif
MKKSILIAVLGVAACAATSYGQGYVVMNSYSANNGAGAISTANGVPLDSTWTAELYFALGTVSDSPGLGLPSGAFTALPSSLVNFDANGDGYFQLSTPVAVPGYTSGAISFEILVDGIAYHGGAFTESKIGTDPASPPSIFGDNGPGMPAIIIVSTPEPTTLALAGLGGLASIVALRRKQS